jgi:hypothetical protein
MPGFTQRGVVAALAVAALARPTGQTGDPAKVLAAAREALGGEKRLSAVKTFVATGRTRQVRGDNLVPIEFEIACELPDKYVRKDEIPAQESGPTSTGFNGDELIQAPPPSAPAAPFAMAGRAGAPTTPEAQLANARKARVATVKQDFVRLTLGMFATSFSSYPLTFAYVGQAEAPQGKADVLDVKGAANFAVRLFVNTDTHLPIMVSWQLPTPAGRGRGPGDEPPAGAPQREGAPRRPPVPPPPPGANPPATAGQARGGDPSAAGRQAPPAGQPPAPGQPPSPPAPRESRIYFADYRDVNGMQFPFRLRRAVAGETIEETTFDGFKINVRVDPKKFEVPK